MAIEREELQFLGFFDVCKESIKIIFTRYKIFAIIFLAHLSLSLLPSKIIHNGNTSNQQGTFAYSNISDVISLKWTGNWLIEAADSTFHCILSLLSTIVVVYTTASFYISKDISFKKVLSAVPKVWKRLLVTFLWSMALILVYHIFLAVVVISIGVDLYYGGTMKKAIGVVLILLYLMGLVYISVIWALANVVSVLEDYKGFQAMVKSKTLMEGKMGILVAASLVLASSSVLIKPMFEKLVVMGRLDVGGGGSIGIEKLMSSVLKSMVFLFGLVVETVVYFVCKTYHHEDVGKEG